MYENPTEGYQFSNKEGTLWLDAAAAELDQMAEADFNITAKHDNGKISVNCDVRYALSANGKNVNLFTVVMEDKLVGYQDNNRSAISDPNLGEWGKDGIYGSSRVYPYYFDNVARAVIGGYNGDGGYIPSSVKANTEYTPSLTFDIPNNIKDTKNMKVACALIDANTGKVINAAVAKVTELNSIYDAQETPSMQIQTNGNVIRIQSASAEPIIAHAYTIDGRLLGAASRCAQADIHVGHYHGIVIVKAQAGQKVVTKKIWVRP
jgi:hypothetical protein